MEEGLGTQKGGGISSGGGRVKARYRGNRGSSSSSAGKKFFRCTVCSYVTNVKARFTKHVKYHSMPSLKCPFCDFSTPYKWNLDRHQKNHNGGGDLHCPLCNFTADIKQSLTVHVQNHHSSLINNTEHQVKMDMEEVVYNQKQMMLDNDNGLEMEEEYDEFEDEDIQQQEELEDEEEQQHDELKTNGNMSPPELGSKQLLGVVRKQSIGDEVDDSFSQAQKKSTFLQSLALKPNVLYSIDAQALPPPPKLTTPKSSPPRRPSVTTTTTTTEVSPNRKLLATTVKKSREKRLLLEELAQKLVAASKCEVEDNSSTLFKNSVTITSNSTRCQFCRQRCKTSTDLALHLTMCTEALRASADDSSNSNDKGTKTATTVTGENLTVSKQPQEIPTNEQTAEECCTSENKIFVWNNYPYEEEEDQEVEDMSINEGEYDLKTNFLDASGGSDDLVGFETSPGIGAIHMGKLEEMEYEGYIGRELEFDGHGSVTTNRKVYRCPQPNCGFWATTASRFHVHIVGHFNMKPFECSQCSYKSNWRWDITKHIKLKALRDISHTKAKILLTHESGQRNYRKYDRYLIMMQLKHSASSKLPDCSTVASKRNVELELSPPSTKVSSPKVSPQAKMMVTPSNLTMPKLTRAPIVSRASSPSNSVKSEDGVSGRPRPPPALVPISSSSTSATNSNVNNTAEGRTIVEKKMLSGGHIVLSAESSPGPDLYSEECEVGPPNKKSRAGTEGNLKKILWKCKKCSFRHASKEIVVFHIRQYHKPKRGESVSILSPNFLSSMQNDNEASSAQQPPRRKSSSASTSAPSVVKETHQYQYIEDESEFRCKFCPFRVDKLQVMEAHAENHFSKPNCHFSCPHCSFSVSTKRELLDHVPIHANGAYSWNSLQKDERVENLKITAEETPPKPRGSTNGGSAHKKYHCTECPYVTDSKGQFLYHKQFHRPRDCPFRCSQCSYTVSHKHLLHQHLRVHGLPPLSPTPMSQLGLGFGLVVNDDGSLPMDDQPLNLHQSKNSGESIDEEHPTVLVDGYGRMYRCKFCPQVYGKVSDLNEHEMTHDSIQGGLNESPSHAQQNATMSPNFSDSNSSSQVKSLHCCEACPARFFHDKELEIHTSFHQSKSEFQCHLCTYSAKQQNPHLLSHMKVHGIDYQMKTQQLLLRYPRASPPATKSRKKAVAAKNLSSTLNIPQVNQYMSINNISSSVSSSVIAAATPKTTILCQKCPAKFHSKNAYQQHITFHGRSAVFTCRHCDYGVETLKNLTLHELLHAGSEIATPDIFGSMPTTNHKGRASTNSLISPALNDGSIDENAYIGNPDFTYPTYVKNGRIKEKRYKCSKCPSAFEKRDQYKVHTGLHGSDQRYKCGVCDYAVTYYANFIQHLKKHANQPDIPAELLIARPYSKMKGEGTSVKKTTSVGSIPIEAVTVDSVGHKNKKVLSCSSCPFTTLDSKIFQDHKTQHIPTPGKRSEKSSLQCTYCDFTTTKKTSLKQHIRLHFFVPAEQLDSYMYAKDVNVFVDSGSYDENEKIYSEKENYDDDNDKEEEGTGVITTYVDIKKCLPVPMLQGGGDESDDAEEENCSNE